MTIGVGAMSNKERLFSLVSFVMGLLVSLHAHADTTPNLDPIPGYYQEPGINPGRDYVNQHAQERVDPFTGKLQLHYVDLFLPGNGGLDIKVQRSYTSGDGFLRDPSPFGIGWTMGFGRILRSAQYDICDMNQGSAASPVLEMPDGTRQLLYVNVDSATQTLYYFTLSRWKATCATSGAVGLILYSPDGTRYDMTYQGQTVGAGSDSSKKLNTFYPTLITDRNGNTLTLTHKQVGVTDAVSSVVANDGRRVDFTYDANGILQNVKDGSGQKTFTYSTKPVANASAGYVFLIAVTRPDHAQWKYDYNETFDSSAGAGSIYRVTYPTGGSLQYTYDNTIQFGADIPALTTHVVKQKTDGSNTWTYTYTPAAIGGIPSNATALPCPDTNGYFDMTKVEGPDGTHIYCHIGYNSINAANGLGYAIGTMVGSLASDQTSQASNFTEMEAYEIAPETLSTLQSMIRSSDKVPLATAVTGVQYRTIKRSKYGQDYLTTLSNYDNYGNAQTIVETGTATRPDSSNETRTTQFTYKINTNKWILHQKQSEQINTNGEAIGSVSRNIDDNGNVLSETKFGVTTAWTYLSTGDISTKTDARGYVSTYGSYKCGIPQTESFPIDALTVASAQQVATTTRVVNDACNVVSVTDPESKKTWYSFDGLGRITNISYPTGNYVMVQWIGSPLTRTISRGSYMEVTRFDGFGRVSGQTVTDLTTNKSLITSFVNDALGRHLFKSYPGSNIGTAVIFGVNDEPYAIGRGCINPYTSSKIPSCQYWKKLTWKKNVHVVTDENGHSTSSTYRGFGNPDALELVSIKAPDASADTTLARNGMGQITSVTQGGLTRSYDYYPTTYFLYHATDPETGVTTYGRDAVGDMTSKQVGGSAVTSYQYDGLRRLIEIDYPTGTPSVLRTYYKDNKLATVTNGDISSGTIPNPVAKRELTYDSNKNLKTEKLTISGAATPYVLTYGYDSNDALNSIAYVGSTATVTYSPDGFGRPVKAAPYVTSVGYHNASSQINSISYANGVTSTPVIDDTMLWVQQITHSQQLGISSILSTYYAYDGTGNILNVSDSTDASYSRALGYDALDRLTSVQGPWGAGVIGYDSAGNLKSQSYGGVSASYTYDGTSNLLKSISGGRTYQFTYDDYGNVTNNGTQDFTYNDANNLTCTKCGKSGQVVYAYDGLGQRVSETSGGTTTFYVHSSSGRLMMEQTGATIKKYIYLAGKQVAVDRSAPTTGAGAVVTGGSTTLSVSMSPSTTTPSVGSSLTYSVTVSNTGAQDAQNVQVVDALPQGFTFVSASPGCALSGGIVTCAVASVAAQGSANFQIVVQPTVMSDVINGVSLASETANTAAAAATLSTAKVSVTAATTTSLSLSTSSALPGQAVTLTAIVSGSSPSGSVTFMDGTTSLGSAALSGGTATFTATFTTSGVHNLTAIYGGDSANGTSTSSVMALSVNQASTTTALTVDANPALEGQSVTLTATVTGVSPTGSVTFYDGSTPLGSVQLVAGSAEVGSDKSTFVQTVNLPGGFRQLRAVYSGDVQNASSTSTAMSEMVNPTALVILMMLAE